MPIPNADKMIQDLKDRKKFPFTVETGTESRENSRVGRGQIDANVSVIPTDASRAAEKAEAAAELARRGLPGQRIPDHVTMPDSSREIPTPRP